MAMKTQNIMLWVLAALFPGFMAMTFVWGPGVLWNAAWLCILCLVSEALSLYLKGVQQRTALLFELKDASVLVTAILIAICLPPFTHVGILSLAALAAVGLAKHAYGGLGRNVFNPAMVGYAVVLVSFPQALANWPSAGGTALDGFSGATLLTDFRYRSGTTVFEFEVSQATAVAQQRMIAFWFLAGGLLLVYKKLIAWRVTAGMFAGLALAALFGYDQGSSLSLGGAWFHWTMGGFMAAAFFVVTDPVTHPRQHRHQIIFGLTVGVFVYLIRAYGTFPDGIAFAVLFANCLTPFLNRLPAKRLSGSRASEQNTQEQTTRG
jgi:electron transport complex protein RnfD